MVVRPKIIEWDKSKEESDEGGRCVRADKEQDRAGEGGGSNAEAVVCKQ